MPEFTQGICRDGAAILRNGAPMTPEEIVIALRSLASLVELKKIKEELMINPNGRIKDFYDENKQAAWIEAEKALGL